MSELEESTPFTGSVTHLTSEEARATVSNVAMCARLSRVAQIAADALADLPADAEKCWEHLRLALGKIETEMLIHTAEEPSGDSPAEAQSRREEKPWKPLEIPECGIDFTRYSSKDCEVYICAWQSGDGSISHVYEVRCRKVEEGKWAATLSNDGRKLCTLAAPSRELARRCALGAMRNYLHRGHRKTLRAAKKEGGAE